MYVLLPIFTILATQNHILFHPFCNSTTIFLHPSYSNSLPTPHTLFPYVLLSNHPLISHYCTYCLHKYYYTSSGALTFGTQTPSPPKNSYCLYNSVSPHEKGIRSVHFPPFHSTTCTALIGIGYNLL